MLSLLPRSKVWGYLVPQGLDSDCIDLESRFAIWKLGRMQTNQIILPTLTIGRTFYDTILGYIH